MLFPLLGLLEGPISTIIMGLIVIAIHPKWKISITNLLLFSLGCFIGKSITEFIPNSLLNTFQSISPLLLFYVLMVIFGATGGYTAIKLGRKVLKKD